MVKLSCNAVAIALLGITTSCATSRVYSPSPVSVVPRRGMISGIPLRVGIFDARTDTTASSQLKAELLDLVDEAYPSATVQSIPRQTFYSDAASGAVTLRITIAGYGSGFGSKALVGVGQVAGQFGYIVVPEGKWNGVTAFAVTLIDRRDSVPAKSATTVEKVVSKPNTLGYKTAKDALSESFSQACHDLLLWVDTQLLR